MVKIWLDTATDFLFLAITNETEMIDSVVAVSEKKHSDTALYQLQSLMDKHSITNEQIQAMYIGAGPGSYSGIRIARTIAKTMQLVQPVECFQFSTLEFLAKLQKDEKIALKAGREQVYARENNQDCLMKFADTYTMFDSKSSVEQPLSLAMLCSLSVESLDKALPNYIKAAI